MPSALKFASARVVCTSLAELAKNIGNLHCCSNLSKQTALADKGEVITGVGDSVTMRDLLTGSTPEGRAIPGNEDHACRNWTGSGEGGDDRTSRSNGPQRQAPGKVVELIAFVPGLQ